VNITHLAEEQVERHPAGGMVGQTCPFLYPLSYVGQNRIIIIIIAVTEVPVIIRAGGTISKLF
jgi:hypothetical protein